MTADMAERGWRDVLADALGYHDLATVIRLRRARRALARITGERP